MVFIKLVFTYFKNTFILKSWPISAEESEMLDYINTSISRAILQWDF